MSSDPKIAEHTEFAAPPIKDGKADNGAGVSSVVPTIDEETNRKLLRKIDMRLMPVVRPHPWNRSLISKLTYFTDVFHIRPPILRQGAPQPGSYLRAQEGSGS